MMVTKAKSGPPPDAGRPDPSLATQQQMDRALKSEREISEARLDGLDKSVAVRADMNDQRIQRIEDRLDRNDRVTTLGIWSYVLGGTLALIVISVFVVKQFLVH